MEKLLVFAEQMVELGAVRAEFRLKIEKLLEDALNGANVFANRNLSTKLAPQIMRCRQMVRVRVGLQNPLHAQAMLA